MKTRIRLSLFSLFALAVFCAPASAQAESAWWNITTGARPGYLHAGVAQSEVQQLTVTTGERNGHPEQAGLSLTLGETTLRFATEPTASELPPFFGFKPLTAAELQAGLEGPYGTGDVTVSAEGAVAGALRFRIDSTGGQAVPALQANALLVEETEATVSELQKGRSDGQLYATFVDIGNTPIATASSPLKFTDELPAGLKAIGIVATKPGAKGAFNTREVIPCDLATLTCTVQREESAHGEILDALAPFEPVEIRVNVDVTGPVTGPNRVSVDGGQAFRCEAVPAGTGSYADSGCMAEEAGGSFQRAPLAAVPSSQLEKQLTIKDEPTPFGVETYELRNENEGGSADTAAASHPFQQTTTINLNQGPDVGALENLGHKPHVQPAGSARDLHFQWPPGLIGNPSGLTQCSDEQFFQIVESGLANACPPSSAAGVAVVYINEPAFLGTTAVPVPLFNLVPHYGEPARFGFNVAVGNAPVVIDTSLRSDGDYGLTVETNSITQVAGFLSSVVTVWGAPGSPAHNAQRGWSCLFEASGKAISPSSEGGLGPCSATEAPPAANPSGFLFLPTSCGPPPSTPVLGDTWANPLAADALPILASYQTPQLDSCNKVPFKPEIEAEPTSNAATSPTGFNFDINVNDEGQQYAKNKIQSQIKKAVVTLPQGFTTNPSVAEGLKACPLAAYEHSTLDGSVACPEESKVGEVEIESPLVKPVVHGSLYVAKQGENPNQNNLLTIYLVARNPELGVMVKQALRVTPDPVSGQLTTEVDNIPQLPFSRFHLSFRQGQRSPLITPPACGIYTVTADLYPYSNPSVPLHDESSFQITAGPEGQGCPSGGTPPFHPNLTAGSENPTAGAFSPFYTDITRKDSEQEITHFSIKLPPGVIGKLAGVSECSDAAIAQAKSREVEGGGSVEESNPSCPKNSEVGHTSVGSGVGNVLAYAPGKLYLAGPYHGSNISLVSITAAKVGPFDLGTVVVRFALKIDPETAEVFVDSQGSDPIPHIVDGIPVHLRDIQAFVDRPDFTLNPTSCAKKSTASTVLGSGLDFASEADDQPVTITSPFQVGSCASLSFKPKLALSLRGGTKRGSTPAFKAVLTYPKGANANIARSVVSLPHSEFLEQSHIGTVCTRVQFKEGKVPGEKCPAASIYGRAEAITPLLDEPLKGAVYLRSSSHNLPDLVAALHNNQVDFALDGRIDSAKGGGLRNTFETVPDAPVSKFVLEMKGGKKGLLVNSVNLCNAKHRAVSEFTGQNGKVYDTKPVLQAKCPKKGKKPSKHRAAPK